MNLHLDERCPILGEFTSLQPILSQQHPVVDRGTETDHLSAAERLNV